MKRFHNSTITVVLFNLIIITSLAFPLLFYFNSDKTNSKNDSSDVFIFSANGINYMAKHITKEDVEEMKEKLASQPQIADSRSNVIIDGHGTGYTINSESLNSLIGKVSLLEIYSDDGQKYRATADLSTEPYFPSVGDQGSQGSCSAWANAYYAYGYLEAKDYGWDASSGNPDYLLSPAWAYNIVSAYDYGSVPYEVAQVLLDWGVPTLSAMPYDDSDVNSWGDEAAWREAPYHRPLNYTLITYSGSTTIDLIKSLIASGTPVTIGIDSNEFSNGLHQGTGDFILSSDEYDSTSLNHAQCFVGYDDSITEGTDVGAFRVVNSWGDAWMDDGYYWLTYDAFAEFASISAQTIMFIADRINYNPDLIATWQFSSAPTRMDDIVTLGVGPYGSAFDFLTPYYDRDINNYFPDFMTLDISDFYSYYTLDNDVFFFLEIGPSETTGTISSFKIERYSGGILQEITTESPDVPKTTPGYVNATFKAFLHELRVDLEVPTDPILYNSYLINATIYNNGIADETSVLFELLINGIIESSTTIPTLLSGSNYTLDYNWTPSLYDDYNITAKTPPISGETYDSNNQATELIPILGPIFYDDFESGLSKWDTITGMWHLTNISSIWSNSYHSPTHSMWFGNESTGTYDSGYREMGELTSIPIDLTGIDIAKLEFYHWREGEGGGYDESYVYISTDGVNWDQIYVGSEGYISPWEKISIDISTYSGNSSVQVQFYFDTSDGLYNDYRGWLVDDVMISGDVMISHDLRVSLEVPKNPKYHNSYMVNATVTNIGMSDETDIEFFLYLNGTTVNSTAISSLASGISYTLDYLWTPLNYGEYNITAYCYPVLGEEFIINNMIMELISLHKVILFDSMFLNYSLEMLGTNYNSSFSYTDNLDGSFHQESSLYQDEVLVASGSWDVDCQTRILTNPTGSFTFGSGTHTPLWLHTDVSTGNLIPVAIDGEGDHIFNVTGDCIYELLGFELAEAWKLEDLTLPGGVAFYEKNTGVLLYGNFTYGGGASNYILDLWDTNAPIEYINLEHDLIVYLETPIIDSMDKIYGISATVKNNGLYDETDVWLYLYLDGGLVQSLYIPTLTVGMEQTLEIGWTPGEYATYNFTAYAPAVPFETYTDNNRRTNLIYFIETQLFDGLYIKHNYSEGSAFSNTNFTYSYINGKLFDVSLGINNMGAILSYSWVVDAQTRLISGSSPFGYGVHTPAWIFTNVSLSDEIPIAVDGEGDHLFNVSGDLVYNLPGFGLVEVWKLEDVTQPGGVALYEKSTGILLNSTFLYSSGAYNYSFYFTGTNALIDIVEPPKNFSLSSNAGSPDDDGIFDLTWTSAYSAKNYSIYWGESYITVINGTQSLIANEIIDLELEISGYSDGTYYFVVVAHNNYGDTLSNCIQVDISLAYEITVIFPDSSSSWEPGTTVFIIWTSTVSISNVKIQLYRDDSLIMEITSDTPSDGNYSWSIPSMLVNSKQYQVKILDVSNFSIFDFSDYFEIATPTETPGGIPGYHPYFLIGVVGIVSMIIILTKRDKFLK
jgi:C1A family cysteine protease